MNNSNYSKGNFKYPKRGELVFCTVHRLTPFAAWCTLDEYGIEGMIHVSEVAGKWVRDIRDFVKLGKRYVAKVVRVDPRKGFVNLSLKRVSKYDKREKVEKYRKEMRARKILEQAAKQLGVEEAKVEEIALKLEERFESLFAAFEEEAERPGAIAKFVPKEWYSALRKLIARAFQKKEITIKAVIELSSLAPDGIERIKQALNEIERAVGAKPKYLSAPKYRVNLKTKNPKAVEKKLRTVLENIVKKFEQSGGMGRYEILK